MTPEEYEVARAAALDAVAAFATSTRIAVVGTSDPVKLAGYADKAKMARMFIDYPREMDELSVMSLHLEAAERGLGETAEELCEVIVLKAGQLRLIRAQIDAIEDRLRAAVKAAPYGTDLEALLLAGKTDAVARLQAAGLA